MHGSIKTGSTISADYMLEAGVRYAARFEPGHGLGIYVDSIIASVPPRWRLPLRGLEQMRVGELQRSPGRRR